MPRTATAIIPTSIWPVSITTSYGEDDPPAPPARRRARAVAVAAVPEAAVPEFVGPPAPNTVAPWPVVTAETSTKLAFKMGIELTMIPEVLVGKKGSSYDSRIVQNYAGILDAMLDQKDIHLHNRDPHRDQMAVEVPSKPFTKWGEVKHFYDTYTKMMLTIGLLPHHPKISSGGGHIHISGVSNRTITNILRDFQNKPWLMWVFNEPDDDTSANNFTDSIEELGEEMIEAARKQTTDPSVFADELSAEGKTALLFFADPNIIKTHYWFPDDKNRVLRYVSNFKTLEFRMFEAPSDWAEQEAQIRFVEAYVQYIEKTYKTTSPLITITKGAQLKAMKVEQCEADFRALLTTIGLPHAPYERFIKENLHFRFKRGNRI